MPRMTTAAPAGDPARRWDDRGGGDAALVLMFVGGSIMAWLIYAAGTSWFASQTGSKVSGGQTTFTTVPWSTPPTFDPSKMPTAPTYSVPRSSNGGGGGGGVPYGEPAKPRR